MLGAQTEEKGAVMAKKIGYVASFLFLSLISAAAPRKRVTYEPTRYINSGHASIAVIGVGAVGATTAYSILMRDIASEIILVDVCPEKCMGEVFDMSDAIPASSTARITLGSIQEAGHADIIIITAGVRRKPGQSRLELIRINQKIVASIVENLMPINPRAVVIVVSNPVDIMTLYVQRLACLPLNQIFGSGTYLDTMRLRCFIADKFGISPQSIDAYILGEHGDSQFVVWSSAQIAGVPLKNFAGMTIEELDRLAQLAKQKGQDIITLKDATFYGIAACVADMCESIIFNQKRVFPVSAYHEKFGVCFSLPSVIGENGIEQILSVPLNEQETVRLLNSAKKLSEAIKDSIS
jgi:L-lactate dehydrogenase